MFNLNWWLGLFQVLVIALALFVFYKMSIHNNQSERTVRGLFGLAVLWGASFVLAWVHLDLLAAFFHWIALFLSISLIVIFQPELRKFMALLGNVGQWHSIFKSRVLEYRDTHTLDAICSAVEYMSAKHIGSLIVFPSVLDESAIDKPGIKIDAIITSELLLTIFVNKTPLHDGAVIIQADRISSAGAILPLSQNNLNWKYGTRHRAALGLSEISRATVLVVSEESGDISVAEKGKFTKYDDIKKLRARIERVLNK